jgi:hypothetical protein
LGLGAHAAAEIAEVATERKPKGVLLMAANAKSVLPFGHLDCPRGHVICHKNMADRQSIAEYSDTL